MHVILFPSQPFEQRSVDYAFAGEHSAARDVGFDTLLFDADALDQGDAREAVRRLPESDTIRDVVYRGWMLRAETYASLYDALLHRGYKLINDPEQYAHAHHLPGTYELLEGVTPRSVWTTTGALVSSEALAALLADFGDSPLVLKDFVKSQKHHWNEACFIPSAADHDAVLRVVTRFVELQGESLIGGLVFREFVELAKLAAHSVSGMPLTEEFRVFILDGEPLVVGEYWDEGDYAAGGLDLSELMRVAKRIRSRFITMDVARRTTGELVVMEVGDAQVSGVPGRVGVVRFYEVLGERLGDGERAGLR